MASRHNVYQRLTRGETSFDFVGKWRRWFAISAVIIIIGLISLSTRGLNFSIEFKGGTVWQVASSASISDARDVVNKAVPGFGQATIVILTNSQTGKRTVQVSAPAKITGNQSQVEAVQEALAKMAGVPVNEVTLNDVGPSWGSDITHKAIEAVIVFLVVVAGYIWLRFEGKMAIAALIALIHDILLTIGIYSLSGFQVSPDTVIAFLTVLGYSLYDTIVVFDRIQENTRGLASTNRLTYSDVVNLSVNQVLARSINTSLVAILPILSILVIGAWVLGATALEDFGLALFIGLTTGAYSSIFIASPTLALLKEREPRYAEIRRRLVNAGGGRRISPVAAASGDLAGSMALASAGSSGGDLRSTPRTRVETGAPVEGNGDGDAGSRKNVDRDDADVDAGSIDMEAAPPTEAATLGQPPVAPAAPGRRPAHAKRDVATEAHREGWWARGSRADPVAWQGMEAPSGWLKELIRDVSDFPRPGVVYKDITPLLASAEGLGWCVETLADAFAEKTIDKVIGVEARGFIVAAPIAVRLGAGFVPVRKAGKLPWHTSGQTYDLEYGTDLLEIHQDALEDGERVLIIDDVLATGGTAAAAVRLARALGADVAGFGCIVELAFLGGRGKLDDVDSVSLISYA